MTEFKALGAIADQLDRIGTRNQLYYKFNYRQTFSHTDAKKYTTTTRAHPNQVHPRAVPSHVITIPIRAITLQQDQPQYLNQQHFLTFGRVFENKDPKFFLDNFQKLLILTFVNCILYVVSALTLRH
jgi:glycosyltransferase involved in cell wall biosynthesis